jgi:predicted patatin/cPLA2 family phospholipase
MEENIFSSEVINAKINKIIDKNKANKHNKTILVLSGGGIKGIAHVGALSVLYDNNILNNIETIAGTSVGGVIGFLINIGYKPEELREFIIAFDFGKLTKIKFDPLTFFNTFGMTDGNKFILVLINMMEAKQITEKTTFIELFNRTNKTLIISAACINDKQIHYFSHKTAPNMPIVTAIQMTIAIPIYFYPVKYENKLYVDGGCIDNYPIHIFENSSENVIGIYLIEHKDYVENISNIEDYFINLSRCLFEGLLYNSLKGYEKHTIKIMIPSLNTFNYNLTDIQKMEIYNRGVSTAEKYINKN